MIPSLSNTISKSLILLAGGLALSYVDWRFAGLIGFIFAFTAFDVIGYPAFKSTDVVRYRLLQLAFQIVLLLLVLSHSGWLTVIACLICWIMLVCDLLYYVIVDAALTPFSWFKISPVVWIYTGLLKRESAPVPAVIASAVLGLTISLWLVF